MGSFEPSSVVVDADLGGLPTTGQPSSTPSSQTAAAAVAASRSMGGVKGAGGGDNVVAAGKSNGGGVHGPFPPSSLSSSPASALSAALGLTVPPSLLPGDPTAQQIDSVVRGSPPCFEDAPSSGSRATASIGRMSPSSTFSDESGRLSASGVEGVRPSSQQPAAVKAEGLGSSKAGRRAAAAAGRRRGGEVVEARSISDCFARFSAMENLTARMACDSCSAESVYKTKQMSFCSLPRVLVLHLKRFDAMADKKIDVSAVVGTFHFPAGVE